MAMDIQTKIVISDDAVRNLKRADASIDHSGDNTSKVKAIEAQKAREEAAVKQAENRKAIIEAQIKAKTLDETRGKVISESKDGDTVRATKESLLAAKDGLVLPKNEFDETPAKEKVLQSETAKTDAPVKEDVKNLNNYTEDQLEILYRQGKITRQDRDKEIRRREEIDEARGEDTSKDNATKASTTKEDNSKIVSSKITDDKKSAAETIKENDRKSAENSKARRQEALASEQRTKKIEESQEALTDLTKNMGEILQAQSKLKNDPDLDRFETVEGFNISLTQ